MMENTCRTSSYCCFVCYEYYPNKKALTMHINQSKFCNQIINNNYGNTSETKPSCITNEGHNVLISSKNHSTKDVTSLSSVLNYNNSNKNRDTNNKGLDNFDNIDIEYTSNNNETTIYTSNLRHEIKLLKIINQLGIPLYGYKILIDWAQDICTSQNQFQPQHNKYHQAIKHLELMFNLKNCCPEKIPVKLHGDNMELPVITFNVSAMLESLFNDPNINRIENLVVNQSNCFGKFEPTDRRLGEVNSGKWYKTAYKNCIKDPKNGFLCPSILASDKTTLSKMGDLHVDAIFMTTSIFNYEVRIFFH